MNHLPMPWPCFTSVPIRLTLVPTIPVSLGKGPGHIFSSLEDREETEPLSPFVPAIAQMFVADVVKTCKKESSCKKIAIQTVMNQYHTEHGNSLWH